MTCFAGKKHSAGDAVCGGCYDDMEDDLNQEIEEFESKIEFLRLPYSWGTTINNTSCFSDVVLVASNEDEDKTQQCTSSPIIPAHRVVLASRSRVFKSMLENKKDASSDVTIMIIGVLYNALHAFVKYLYTGEACLDEQLACDLLTLAEKYKVDHLKTYCEKYLVEENDNILEWEKSLAYYIFARQHNAKSLLDAAMELIMDNMDKLTKCQEYKGLVCKYPEVVIEIYEAYFSRKAYYMPKQVGKAPVLTPCRVMKFLACL